MVCVGICLLCLGTGGLLGVLYKDVLGGSGPWEFWEVRGCVLSEGLLTNGDSWWPLGLRLFELWKLNQKYRSIYNMVWFPGTHR